MKKNPFDFAYSKETDDFLIDEPDQDTESELEQDIEEKEKKAKKAFRKRVYKASILMFIISVALVGFGLFWQDEVSLMAIGDALWLAFALEFGVGWIMFIYNQNILSPLIHGFKTLGLMFVGKRPKKDYYEYMKSIEEDPIPRFYYIVVLTSALILLIPALIILFILI